MFMTDKSHNAYEAVETSYKADALSTSISCKACTVFRCFFLFIFEIVKRVHFYRKRVIFSSDASKIKKLNVFRFVLKYQHLIGF